jgi:hypothetical protein
MGNDSQWISVIKRPQVLILSGWQDLPTVVSSDLDILVSPDENKNGFA